ncbi:transposase [Streptomyces sp. NPDC052036]|uniref:transposase n=1 Tax=Streptomyces sp. NPDC052036 TaxID=3155171 RepID=UPI00343B9E8E
METVTAGEVGSHGRQAAEVRCGVPRGAVRIVTETGKAVAEVAKDLGINEITLASWVSRARRAGTAPGGGSDVQQRAQGRVRPPAHFRHPCQGRIRIATWITDFCTARRLHSVCGFKSPIDYEHDHRATLTEGLVA